MNKTAAIVVTYNRLALLKENISSLLKQTVLCDVIIINNASTDGTEDYLNNISNKRIYVINSKENVGGAGGFYIGIKKAEQLGYRYIWIMDDDSVPNNNALESLEKKAEKLNNEFSYISSLVYWTDGHLFRMNVPVTVYDKKQELDTLQLLSENKLMQINNASFVGCFVNTEVSKKIGLPIKDFFIYGDDYEYTIRLVNEKKAYLDIDSVIIHKAPSNRGADIVSSSKDRIDRFYYQSRNGMYIARKERKIASRIYHIIGRVIKVLLYSKECKFKKIRVLICGTIDGFKFNPIIEFSGRE